MKKHFYFLFSACVLFVLLSFLTCQKEMSSGISTEIPDLDGRLARFNVGKLAMKQGELLEGEAVVLPRDNNELAIGIQDRNGMTYIYTLQSEKKVKDVTFRHFKNAQVLFLRNSVVLNALDTPERILLSIKEETINELNDLQFTKKMVGFGLSRTSTSKIPSIKNLEKQEIVNLVDTYTCTCRCRNSITEPDDSDCQAGGRSSNSCSIEKEGSSCSTECSGASYACCKCTKDSSGSVKDDTKH